jgi:hypothetical protein
VLISRETFQLGVIRANDESVYQSISETVCRFSTKLEERTVSVRGVDCCGASVTYEKYCIL